MPHGSNEDVPPIPERMYASVTAEKKMSLWTVMEQFGTADSSRNYAAEGEIEKTELK